jgi:hypothetical protein
VTRIVGIENEFMSVWCCPEQGIVHHVMHKFVVSAMLRQGLEVGLSLLAAHQATKWLSDDRKNGPLSAADGEWGTTDWLPRAVQAGWRHWAMVLPEQVLGQMKMRQQMSSAVSEHWLNVKTFSDAVEALQWLESLPAFSRGKELGKADR